MENPSPHTLPWSTPPLWQAANQTIAHALRNHQGALKHLVSLAGAIRERINALNDAMDTLCALTCTQCRKVCCLHAHVYYDFKDLLYLHLTDGVLPGRQTMDSPHHTCSYLGPEGCHLPRDERPFVCTWYLCPDQRACLARFPSSSSTFMQNSMKALKLGREQLETGYIRVIAGALLK